MDLEKLLNEKSSSEIYSYIEQLAIEDTQNSIENLVSLLLKRDSDIYDKHVIPRLVCRALLTKGEVGVQKIKDSVTQIDSAIYSNAAIESLWYACEKEYPSAFLENIIEKYPKLCKEIDDKTKSEAEKVLFDLIIESQLDPEIFYKTINFFYLNTIKTLMGKGAGEKLQKRYFTIISDSMIRITQKMILEFKSLIECCENEEKYQLFLENNPAFLDPLASRVIDKHRLGDDLITDYVVETLKGEYIAVEIEKPQNKIFTQRGDFTSDFSHAFGQVLDFIEWIESNIAYARVKLPDITSPKGMLIMGRSIDLTEENLKKLRRFNNNSKSIEVLTYDDLINRAETLYRNLRRM